MSSGQALEAVMYGIFATLMLVSAWAVSSEVRLNYWLLGRGQETRSIARQVQVSRALAAVVSGLFAGALLASTYVDRIALAASILFLLGLYGLHVLLAGRRWQPPVRATSLILPVVIGCTVAVLVALIA